MRYELKPFYYKPFQACLHAICITSYFLAILPAYAYVDEWYGSSYVPIFQGRCFQRVDKLFYVYVNALGLDNYYDKWTNAKEGMHLV